MGAVCVIGPADPNSSPIARAGRGGTSVKIQPSPKLHPIKVRSYYVFRESLSALQVPSQLVVQGGKKKFDLSVVSTHTHTCIGCNDNNNNNNNSDSVGRVYKVQTLTWIIEGIV